MASFPEACVSGSSSGGDSSGSEAGSSCLQFGVHSYLHHFYEECSSSVWDRDPEDQEEFDQAQRSTQPWSSRIWKVSLALGVLVLTAGVASLSVGYSTERRIESFSDGDLLFVDSLAIRFNKGLLLSVAAGIGLSCVGTGLVLIGVFHWLCPRTDRGRSREKLSLWEEVGSGGRKETEESGERRSWGKPSPGRRP